MPKPRRGQDFFLDAAHAQDAAAQADFARHRRYPNARGACVNNEASATTIVTPALGPSFGVAPGGHVDVDVVFAIIGHDPCPSALAWLRK